MDIIIKTGRLGEIPYMFYTLDSLDTRPLIIISHGFNCTQYEGASMALQLVQNGFHVITYDLSEHGARYNGFLERMVSDTDIGMSMMRIIENSYSDLETLIASFKNEPNVDSEKIGLTGFSLGAMLTFYALTKNNMVSAAIPIIGSPNFIQSIVYGMEKTSIDDFKSNEEVALLTHVKRLDPLEKLLELETRPMLIINASRDDDMPCEHAQVFFERMKPKYDEFGGKIDFYLADDFHVVNNDMIQRSIEWLKLLWKI